MLLRPPGGAGLKSERDCPFVAGGELSQWLPLGRVADWEQKPGVGHTRAAQMPRPSYEQQSHMSAPSRRCSSCHERPCPGPLLAYGRSSVKTRRQCVKSAAPVLV